MFRPVSTLTMSNAQTVLKDGMRAIADGQVEIDLGGVTVVDSAAVATLLGWERAARRSGKTLRLQNIPVNLQSLIALYGVAELLSSTAARIDMPHH